MVLEPEFRPLQKQSQRKDKSLQDTQRLPRMDCLGGLPGSWSKSGISSSLKMYFCVLVIAIIQDLPEKN